MHIPTYPHDFMHYDDAVPIGNMQINDWIKECIENIESEDLNSCSKASGDTRVIVKKIYYDESETAFEYQITVDKNRSVGYIHDLS